MTKEIFNSRKISTTVERLYDAFANPDQLKFWWGPEGFSNTIHNFDLRVGGNWNLTMHGPEKGNYENSSVFTIVEPKNKVAWKRLSPPHFSMEVGFEKSEDDTSVISFRMIFESAEECEKMRKYVEPKNEENFDRLERFLQNTQG